MRKTDKQCPTSLNYTTSINICNIRYIPNVIYKNSHDSAFPEQRKQTKTITSIKEKKKEHTVAMFLSKEEKLYLIAAN